MSLRPGPRANAPQPKSATLDQVLAAGLAQQQHRPRPVAAATAARPVVCARPTPPWRDDPAPRRRLPAFVADPVGNRPIVYTRPSFAVYTPSLATYVMSSDSKPKPVPSVSEPVPTTALLVIDPQYDFVEGSLTVRGAEADMKRIAAVLTTKQDAIDAVIATQDWHTRKHISHAGYWKRAGKGGTPLEPTEEPRVLNFDKETTTCTVEVAGEDGKVVPVAVVPARDPRPGYTVAYLRELVKSGKVHMIWPDHCIANERGAMLDATFAEAVSEWEMATGRTLRTVRKGEADTAEMYSVFKAEVEDEKDKRTFLNTKLITDLKQYDTVLVCGEASSHCVAESVRHLLGAWTEARPELGGRSRDPKDIVLLTDCMSPVSGNEWRANIFLHEMREAKLTLLTSDRYMHGDGVRFYTSDHEGDDCHRRLADAIVDRPWTLSHPDAARMHVVMGDIATIGSSTRLLETLSLGLTTTGMDVCLTPGNRDLNGAGRLGLVLYAEEMGLGSSVDKETGTDRLFNACTHLINDEEGEWSMQDFDASKPFDNYEETKTEENTRGSVDGFKRCIDRVRSIRSLPAEGACCDLKHAEGAGCDLQYARRVLSFMAMADFDVLATRLYEVYPEKEGDRKRALVPSLLDDSEGPLQGSRLWWTLQNIEFHAQKDGMRERLEALDRFWRAAKKREAPLDAEWLKTAARDHTIAMRFCFPIWQAVVDMFVDVLARKSTTLLHREGRVAALHAGLAVADGSGYLDTYPWEHERTHGVVDWARDACANLKGKGENVPNDLVRLANLSGVPGRAVPVATMGLATGPQWDVKGKRVQASVKAMKKLGQHVQMCGHQPEALGGIYTEIDPIDKRHYVRVCVDTQYFCHPTNVTVALMNVASDDEFRKSWRSWKGVDSLPDKQTAAYKGFLKKCWPLIKQERDEAAQRAQQTLDHAQQEYKEAKEARDKFYQLTVASMPMSPSGMPKFEEDTRVEVARGVLDEVARKLDMATKATAAGPLDTPCEVQVKGVLRDDHSWWRVVVVRVSDFESHLFLVDDTNSGNYPKHEETLEREHVCWGLGDHCPEAQTDPLPVVVNACCVRRTGKAEGVVKLELVTVDSDAAVFDAGKIKKAGAKDALKQLETTVKTQLSGSQTFCNFGVDELDDEKVVPMVATTMVRDWMVGTVWMGG